jgi:outer membrane protein assembly factor BamB
MARSLFGPLVLASAAVAVPAAAGEWPQFRGPTGLGYTEEADLPLLWGGPDRKNILWQSPLTGQGHASPVVWGERVFVATAFWPESVKDRAKAIPEHHLAAYRASDGRRLWDTLIPPGPWLRTDFRSGPGGGYAAPTPATDGRRVYAAFGSSVIAALDLEGKIVWRREIVPATFDVTLGSSPVLFAETVILLCAMAKKEDSRVVAFDKSTGEVKWERKLPTTGFGHSTPIIIEVEGKPELIVLASGMAVAPDALQALDPGSGRRIWWCRGAGDASSPAFQGGLLYFDSGRGGQGFAMEPGGEGEVTATGLRWTVPQLSEGIGSPIIVGDHVYRLLSPGILRVWKRSTGEQVQAKRLSGLTSTWASPIADSRGRIYFASAGTSVVVQAGSGLEVLATNDLGDENHASPAAAGGRFYLVGQKSLWCIGGR